jgi:eukaryotic-like serine/threonine-protein kinase
MQDQKAEETIFAATLRLPPEQRGSYLEQACGQDGPLRERIEALLAAYEDSGNLLEKPADPSLSNSIQSSPLLSEQIGDRIGRYKLLEQIGEGGCGVVYMAEQEEPVQRRVALKVIKLGMDTKHVIARFEAERQALALMDHPNIAKVLDAGASETGRPFFVMELVRGVKITEYCDHHNLPTKERLELFLQVCRALQHAHQKGIIHRDIKPSNILVTINDGLPVPKVIDFGIAKATQGRLTDMTLFTAFAQFIGTPAYMSPEQAMMTSVDIDTRSDIYSLGVLLYELLTGTTPFDGKELLEAGLEAMRRTIQEKEPERPSSKLSTMHAGELTTTAQRRDTAPPKLINSVRGDLDWIVMKCLEKDRARRYETTTGLARDIERHLAQEPVTACPPSKLYRFQKLVRRNKFVVTAGAAVLASLLVGLGLSTWMYVQERTAVREQTRLRLESQDKEQKARTEAIKSERVARFLKDMLQGVGPSVALGRDTTILREILDKTAGQVGTELTNEPAVQADLFSSLGQVYRAITAYTNAEASFREALAIRTRLWGEFNQDSASSMDELGTVLLEATRLAEAEPLLQKALTVRKQLLGPEHPDVATTLCNIGVLRQYEGRAAEAETRCRESLEIRRKLLGNGHLQVAESLLCTASALWVQQKNLAEAEAMNREALAIRKKQLGEFHPDVAFCLNNLATVYQDQGKMTDAENMFRESLALWRHLLGEASAQEAKVLNNLAWLCCSEGKMPEAERLSRQSLEIRRRVLGQKHDDLAESLNTLAVIMQRKGNITEAEALQREHLEMTISLHSAKHPLVITSKNNLAWVLRSEQKLPEAEALIREALALQRELIGPTNEKVAQLLHNLGALCAEQGRLGQAETLHREGLAIRMGLSDPKDRAVAGSLMLLAHVLCEENKAAEAEPLAKKAVDILQPLQPEHWSSYNAQAILGRSLAAQTNYLAAEPLLLSGCSGMERLMNTIPSDKQVYWKEGVGKLIGLYQATSRTQQASQWQHTLTIYEETASKRNNRDTNR